MIDIVSHIPVVLKSQLDVNVVLIILHHLPSESERLLIKDIVWSDLDLESIDQLQLLVEPTLIVREIDNLRLWLEHLKVFICPQTPSPSILPEAMVSSHMVSLNSDLRWRNLCEVRGH